MTRVMYDSIEDDVPAGATAIAGYVGGSWPTFEDGWFQARKANKLSIAVHANEDAACLDIENGDATPGDAPAWVRRQLARGQYRPVLYASRDTIPEVLACLRAAGIGREKVRIWSAHYGIGPHICSGASCGASFTADATQFTDQALGRNLDESLLDDSFFPAKPKKKKKAKVHPKVKGSTTGAALGVAITAVLKAAHVHITPDEAGAVSTLAALLAGYLTPTRKKA